MKRWYRKIETYSIRVFRPNKGGLTLMEMVIALSIMTIVFASVLPLFFQMRNSWETRQAAAETLQNGRILIDHINRNISKAVKITAVSESSQTSGYIEYENNDAEIIRYDVNSTGNYVEFGPVGTLSDLAGPVSQLKFTCYDACDLDSPISPITDANIIRVVQVETTVSNPAWPDREESFSTWAYLRTNSQSGGDWQSQDIGDVGYTGSAVYAEGTWTINASGNDIWNNTDEFHYAYQPLSGDGQIIARVVSVEYTNGWAKAGVMIRETLDGNSKHAMMVVTPGSGNAFQRRTSTGGSSSHTSGSRVTAPYWVKIIRTGDTLTGYESPDGSVWTEVDSVSISMATDVYIGLAVTSHNDGDICTAVIDNVSFNSITYESFSEAKTSSEDTSLTITTPTTNTGDLLIAAVATDGDTSLSLSPPAGEGWTEIDVDDYSNDVTLGVWWKLTESSESSSHQFSWSNAEPAYGWIMRFSGHNSADPIDAWSDYGQYSATPTSPAVTTTVNNALILRIGAFNSSDIVEDSPGLNGHTAITMDSAAGALFEDSFETDFDKWTDNGFTDWDRSNSVVYSGNYSAWADRHANDLISDNINTSNLNSFTVEFYYMDDDIDHHDDVYLQFYNGFGYANIFELDVHNHEEDQWQSYSATFSNSGYETRYFRTDFRIKFEASSIDNNENLWIDDVVISGSGVSGGAGYVIQSSSGSSGTSSFSLGSANEAKMLTIAIASDNDDSGGFGTIRP